MRWGVIAILIIGSICSVLTSEVDDEEPKPSLEVMARSTVYNAGETKAIFCKGINIEDIDWYNPSGSKVADRSAKNNRIYVEKKKESSGLLVPLIIHDIEISDSGNWTCKGGELSQTISIIVGIKVNVPNRNVTIEGDEDRNIKLNCEANGEPKPVVQWYRGGKPIDESDTKKYSVTVTRNHNYQLEIKSLSAKDVGEYMCIVRQKVLSHYTDKTVYLNVRHKPVFYDPETLATTTAKLQEVYTLLDIIKNITCSVIANPKPTFKWNRRINGYDRDEITDDTIVTLSDDGLVSVLQLRVYNASFLGEYKCTASNIKGKQSIIFDVQLAEPPSPPSYIEFVSSNATSITFNVSCCMPLNQSLVSNEGQVLEVRGYKLQLMPFVQDMSPNWESALEYEFDINEDENYTLITAMDLPNTTTFSGRLCSMNDAGDSEWISLNFNPSTTAHAVALVTSLTLLIVASIVVRLY